MVKHRGSEIDEYFRRYAALVYRRAYSLMKSQADAEDVVQEVFVRVAAKMDDFRGESRVSTWLYRITTNYCLTVIRNRGRRSELLEEHYDAGADLAGGLSASDELALRQLLAQAEPQQAMAAVYTIVDGMTRPEAAEAMGVSLRTIGNLLNRFAEWSETQKVGGDLPDSSNTGVS